MNLGPTLQPEVIHSGWLKKQGGMVKNWQKRWFILVGQEMKYFTKEDENKQMGSIYLPGNKVNVHQFNPDEPSKYLFEIVPGEGQQRITPNHESFLLWSSSQADRDEWVRMIRRVMYSHVGGGVFGQNLIDIITAESTSSTKKIPGIIESCVTFLRENGLQEEGIFRLAGRTALVKQMQEAYDIGKKPDFKEIDADVHSVASLLKLYLRHLPEPLIPWENFPLILDTLRLAGKDEKKGKEELIKQLAFLPRVNYNVLKYLCEFLHDVKKYESSNKMGLRNLATVFGPNIFRSEKEDPQTLMENANLSHMLMLFLIEDCEGMFPKNDQIDFSQYGEDPTKVKKTSKVQEPPPRPQLPKNLKTSDTVPISTKPVDTAVTDLLTSDLVPLPSGNLLQPLVTGGTPRLSDRSTSVDSASRQLENSAKDALPSSVENKQMGTVTVIDTLVDIESNGSVSKKEVTEQPLDGVALRKTPVIPIRPAPSAPPKVPKRPPLGEGTPSVTLPNTNTADMTLSYTDLQMQVHALKEELKKQKDFYEHKLNQLQKRYDGLEIMLKNEAKGRAQSEERLQQLIKDLEAYYKKHGH
ncbi:rho GTPase-activating protein 24-like [Ptychodera flava]|uniref:rho GTPase-activating protein 24-like n=1 Tax=Ptychodera flava TaxID=63121 RepID=UPI003969C3EF